MAPQPSRVPAQYLRQPGKPAGIQKADIMPQRDDRHDAGGPPVQSQAEALAFLQSLGGEEPPLCRETHGAWVFLYPERAIKIKKAVAFPYMDFSTLEKRRQALEQELDVNRPLAPGLYRKVQPIVRDDSGNVRLDGKGTPLEWVLIMARFDEAGLFSRLAEEKRLSKPLIDLLARKIAAHHATALVHRLSDASAPLSRIIGELTDAFSKHEEALNADHVKQLIAAQKQALTAEQELLAWRARQGFVRRCHGDLHLNNIVLWHGSPCLFDAIEFDEEIAIVDTLYDLSFLLMDLDVRGQREASNFLLNRYFFHSDLESDPNALALLPLFLSCRAGIRAMVALDRSTQASSLEKKELGHDARRYFYAAREFLTHNRPCLIAVGGFSGSGKTTLAATLSPQAGLPIGALHLRSDLVRKKLFYHPEETKLPAEAYAPVITEAVYESLLIQARAALTAGASVIVDAVYAKAEERDALTTLAGDLQVPFAGLWLEAPENQLKARVESRHGDASDATPDVVVAQIARGAGGVDWHVIDAGGSANDTHLRALVRLRLQGILPHRG